MTGKEPNCRDKSDEKGCQLILFEGDYNKNIPPIGSSKDGSPIPAAVSISITLMKVVEIEEVDHSIHLQFQISLQWKENRVQYQNLKKETSLNALTDDDIKTIWLPRIVYDNTDQKEGVNGGMALCETGEMVMCDNCGKSSHAIMRCQTGANYCHHKCQREDWQKQHQQTHEVNAGVTQIEDEVPPDGWKRGSIGRIDEDVAPITLGEAHHS